jgi:hypothetical protein
MLKKEELYGESLDISKINIVNTEEYKNKILLILSLFLMIVVIGYLIYANQKESVVSTHKTKVMGVSYIMDETDMLEQQLRDVKVEPLTDTINRGVKYNHTEQNHLTGAKGNEQEQYDEVVVVDDKKEYTDMVVVKHSGY